MPKIKVLVIEDDGLNRRLDRELLMIAGYEVIEAADASTAFSFLEKERPGLIIMDVRLPDMRGTEAARLLRLRPDTQDIPIVFVTASVMPAEVETMRQIPKSIYFSKPIDTRTFIGTIEKFAGLKSA